jgi:hypothetical protein
MGMAAPDFLQVGRFLVDGGAGQLLATLMGMRDTGKQSFGQLPFGPPVTHLHTYSMLFWGRS